MVDKGKFKSDTAILFAYYFTIAVFIAGSFFPEERLFGINSFAYLPLWANSLLLVLALLFPIPLKKWSLSDISGDIASKPYHLIVILFAIVMTSAFVLFQAKTFFLGDGYTLLSLLSAEHPLIKTRNYGGTIVPFLISSLFSERSEATVLSSYRITAFVSGLLFMLLTFVASMRMFKRNRERLLFLVFLSSGGYMLLFFGYVENYSLFVVIVLGFVLTGVLVSRKVLSRLWLLPMVLLSIFFHVFGITLLPATFYLLIVDTRIGDRLKQLPDIFKRLGLALIVLIVSALFYHFYTTEYILRFALVPFVNDRFTVDGYTLLSWQHLVDFLNLLILLLPGIFVVILTMVRGSAGVFLKQTEYRFLLLLVVSVVGATFLIDPKLGMPRDWDLFAFIGVPMMVMGGLAFLKEKLASQKTLLLVSFLGLVALVPRITALNNDDVMLKMIGDYARYDKNKSATIRWSIAKYLDEKGVFPQRNDLIRKWSIDVPSSDLSRKGIAVAEQGRIKEALPLFYEAIRLKPNYSFGYTYIADSYLRLNSLDSAILYARIAVGMNPYDGRILYNLGAVLFARKDYARARDTWKRSMEMDDGLILPLIGMMNMYRQTGPESEYFYWVSKYGRHPDASLELVKRLIEECLIKGKIDIAVGLLKNAPEGGLDSTYLAQLRQKYPQLSDRFSP